VNESEGQAASPRLSQVWQLPLLLVSVVLLAAGWYMALPDGPARSVADELEHVVKLIRAEQFDAAIDALDEIEPELRTLEDSLKADYHLRRGDAITLAQRRRGWDEPRNHRNVIDHYRRARELGVTLDGRRLRWLAESHLALGELEKANALIDDVPAEDAAARWRMRREVIERAIAGGGDPAEHIRALKDFRETDGLPREHEVWAAARQAELLMAAGDLEEAERQLSIDLQRFDFAASDDPALGELMVLLGETQWKLGDRAAAENWFRAAQKQLDPASPLNGRALTGVGEIRFAEDNIVDALARFTAAVADYPETRAQLRALIGKAESESRLGAYDESLATYDRALQRISETGAARKDVEALAESLRFQHDWRFEQGKHELALSYLDRLARLRGDNLGDELLLKLAVTHRQCARSILDDDGALVADAADEGEPPAALSARDRALIAEHFEKAGGYYYRHARAVADDQDEEAYSRSLWNAADCYDQAGLNDRAIELFQEYQATLPEDERDLRASFRLAQAFQARGDFATAAKRYADLVKNHPKSQQAYESYVPLARCYLAQGAEFWGRAEQQLRAVVEGNQSLRPSSRQYREALVELGRLYYRRGEPGDYERAIERLNEAVQRYADHPKLPEMRFQLADAYRKSVAQLEAKLDGPTSPSQRAAVQRERADRLAAAQDAFGKVIDHYESRDPDSLTEIESLYLRNSYFYRADCAYDLRRFEGPDGAIALYGAAADKYEEDPSVLVAHVQIVNSWCELGRFDKARAANERAKWRLARIRDEAFDDPNLPMSREHWKRWLEWTSELALADNPDTASP